LRELALHVMDIAENGLSAQADLLTLHIVEDRKKSHLRVTITDNGRGMSQETLQRVTDPFFTTRTTRRVGLGLSLLREASKRCDGAFEIKSEEGKGTEVSASFRLDHIDLAPMGDMAGSLVSLIMGYPEVDFVYTHEVDGHAFHLDTRDIKKELEGVPVNHPEVLKYIGGVMRNALSDLRGKAGERTA
jgi:hypothetical protein